MVYRNKKEFLEAHILPTDKVLDVGFWGQGVASSNPRWPHRILHERGCDVYGLDLEYKERALLSNPDHYRKESAENFSFGTTFSVIFAGDLIEHLSNPGLFLASARKHLTPQGKLIMTTPNCFNLFNITEKITKYEPTVNRDHTCYFNEKTLKQLLEKNSWSVQVFHHIYTLESEYTESFKKKILNVLYFVLSKFSTKFVETIVVIAVPSV